MFLAFVRWEAQINWSKKITIALKCDPIAIRVLNIEI